MTTLFLSPAAAAVAGPSCNASRPAVLAAHSTLLCLQKHYQLTCHAAASQHVCSSRRTKPCRQLRPAAAAAASQPADNSKERSSSKHRNGEELTSSAQQSPPPPLAAAAAEAGPSGTARQQALQYIALAVLHTVLAAATTLAPGWSLQHLFGFPATTATSLQLINAGAYLWLFATCLVCLKDAALHDRLQSDTYKRLNLGVMYQSVVVVLLMLRHKALLASHVFGCTVAVFAITGLTAGRSYAASVGGLSLPTIVRSLFNNLEDLFKPKGTVSAFYGVCAGLALVQFLWHYPSPRTPLFTTDLGPVAVLLKQARGAGMVLAGVVWYTLKDAADRGRLAASTFRQLNLAMAMVAALQLWGLSQMSYMGVPLNEQLWRALVAGGLAVVVVCDWQYFFAAKAAP